MIQREKIEEVISEYLNESGLFLVDILFVTEDDIEISVESYLSHVTIENCEAIDNLVHTAVTEEDYSLTVGSAGLDRPFKVADQYKKAVGTAVELLLTSGTKKRVNLTAFDGEKMTVTWSALERVEGKKRKVTVEHTEDIALTEIKWCKPSIDFK